MLKKEKELVQRNKELLEKQIEDTKNQQEEANKAEYYQLMAEIKTKKMVKEREGADKDLQIVKVQVKKTKTENSIATLNRLRSRS